MQISLYFSLSVSMQFRCYWSSIVVRHDSGIRAFMCSQGEEPYSIFGTVEEIFFECPFDWDASSCIHWSWWSAGRWSSASLDIPTPRILGPERIRELHVWDAPTNNGRSGTRCHRPGRERDGIFIRSGKRRSRAGKTKIRGWDFGVVLPKTENRFRGGVDSNREMSDCIESVLFFFC